MPRVKLGSLLDALRGLVIPPPSTASDRYLLERFLATQDQAAFASLLGRHGPMVYAACRRSLSHAQDAEDVVQAVFLLLARKAATIRKGASLGSWLYGTACRLSNNLKRRQVNRHNHEQQASRLRGQTDSPQSSLELHELLDTVLQELPEKYRSPLILCYLEGRTQTEAARQLGCPLGTVRSRLARGRDLARKKLARRGQALSAASLAPLLTAGAAPAALPIKLFGLTLHAAVQYASGKALPGLVSASVALLVKSGLKFIAIKKLTWIGVGLLTLAAVSGGSGLAAWTSVAGNRESQPPRQQVRAQAGAREFEKERTDAQGDPLPRDALMRLGTIRLRQGEMVRHLAFSPDGKTILSADGYGVYIWDAATGRLLRRIGEHRDQWSLHDASFAGNGTAALATRSGNIDIVDTSTGRAIRHFDADQFASVALSPDGNVLAVLGRHGGDEDRQSLRLYDAMTGDQRRELKGHEDFIHAFVFSKDSKTLVTSSDDKSIRIWDVVTGKQVRRLDHSTLVGDIALAPNGKTLASVATTKRVEKSDKHTAIMWMTAGEIVLWDVVGGKESYRLEGQLHSTYPLSFTPDSKTFVSSDMKTAKWWDVATGKQLREPSISIPGVMVMAFSADGSTLAAGTCEGTIQLRDVRTGEEKLHLSGQQGWVQAVAIAPDGRTFVTGGGDNQIRIWDAISGREIRNIAGHEYGILSLLFVPDGQTLISTSRDGSVRAWDFATGKELRRFPGSEAALSPDGKLLVTGSKYPQFTLREQEGNDEFIRLWEISTGRELQKWPSNREYGNPLVFSGDGRLIYSWDADRKVRLWDVATGKMVRLFDDQRFRAESRGKHQSIPWAFSHDGKLAALGGGPSGQIALFDVATGKETRVLQARPFSTHVLAFSSDSRVLASGDWWGGTVRLWEVATGQDFQQFAGHKGHVFSLVFSADGKLLLSGNEDTTALAWDVTGARTGPKREPMSVRELESAWSDLSELDAERAQKAVRALLAVPSQAEALFGRELKPAAVPDAKTLAPRIATSQRLRTIRALQVLEQIGTQSSRELLTRLASGAPEALVTQEATAGVERLAKTRGTMR